MSRWTALRLAVEHQWGGGQSQDKAEDLTDEIIEWFLRKRNPDELNLADLLGAAMAEDFSTQCEDGSTYEVAKKLIDLHSQCQANDFSEVERLHRLQPAPLNSCQAQQQQLESEDEEDDGEQNEDGGDMDIDDQENPPQAVEMSAKGATVTSGPVVDDDGFELVQSRRSRRSGQAK